MVNHQKPNLIAMAYGSILTIYGADVNTLNSVHVILNNHGTPFQKLDSTYFLQVPDTVQPVQIRNQLIADKITFTFYFVDDATGDGLAEGGVNDAVIQNIRNILLL